MQKTSVRSFNSVLGMLLLLLLLLLLLENGFL
jgi:hypothetical protein